MPQNRKNESKSLQIRLPFCPNSKILLVVILLAHGVWLSLVERYVRDVEVAGSNPVTPTK
jgi:hypothetical protein